MNYGALTLIQKLIMGLFSQISLMIAIPNAIYLINREHRKLAGIIQLLAIISSAFYHLSEVINQPIIIEQLEWHRLDNIFVLSCFGVTFQQLFGLFQMKWPGFFFLVVSMATQFYDPWNFNYTMFPIISYFVLCAILRLMKFNEFTIKYQVKNLIMFFIILGIGINFMIAGLDEYQDYLRLKHNMWHLCAGLSSFQLFKSVSIIRHNPK